MKKTIINIFDKKTHKPDFESFSKLFCWFKTQFNFFLTILNLNFFLKTIIK